MSKRAVDIRGARVVVAALGLMVAGLAYVDAQGSAAQSDAARPREETLLEKSRRVEVEGQIARTNLNGRIKAALGDAFGGAWFEPQTARLHVGITSPADRQTVEAVAAEAGLAGIVTATPVRSTWAQLAAEQQRWNERLVDLFERGDVKTGIMPDLNAVRVELGTAVPASRRATLEREAATGDVDVSIAVAPSAHLRLVREARCNKFQQTEAYCDPTIVAGVTIEDDKKSAKCTAGPAVVRANPKKPTVATETYILTAGHCIKEASGTKWFAYNKKEERKEIGPAGAFRVTEVDVGVIKVNNPVLDKKAGGYWAIQGMAPVYPSVALWEQEEPEPFGVTGQWEPAKGTEACLSAQTTATQCGEIIQENVKTIGGVEELFEVGGTETEKGDSGGPWWNKGSASLMEGTHVGKVEANGNALFQSLKSSFNTLAFKVELLTVGTEIRHPFEFKSEGGATLTGEKEGEAETFTFDAGTLLCKKATYTGAFTGGTTAETVLTPAYSECTFAGNSATVDVNGCQYVFTPTEKGSFTGGLNISCPEEKKIEVTSAGGFGCRVTIGTQTDLEAVRYTNVGSGTTRKVTIDLNVAGLAYEEHNVFFPTCASSTVAKTNGTYKGAVSLGGETGEKAHRGIWVE